MDEFIGTIVGQKVKPEKLARAKELRREMTDTERILWQHLRANQLSGLRFRRQQVLDGFIADFYCHAARLVIELDGDIHNTQHEYDTERDRVLQARGLRILRIPNHDIENNLHTVLKRITDACTTN